ncbi:hypothetical protein OEZ85_007681 [Tetradesmus obliquus]|uniref:Uncharacterized protein n=1 Tax=Tetradesmus obliquus TaxID=3088 RepID=A0ABY8TGY6_TETOB|nr:hypothetical protein OEZ85_007681 [Tetradesmus obliquus]
MLVNGKPCSRTLSAFGMWHFWEASSGCVRQQVLQTPECGRRCQWIECWGRRGCSCTDGRGGVVARHE